MGDFLKWYKFRKKLVNIEKDVVHYAYYEMIPDDGELEEDYREWAKNYSGLEPAVMYIQIEPIDAPPKDVIEAHLVQAQLVFANAEHQVMIMRREMEYQQFLDEEKLR